MSTPLDRAQETHAKLGRLERQMRRVLLEGAGQGRLFEESKIDRAFDEFHAAHPEVYREFRRAAEQLLGAGIEHYGAGAIFEALRFHSAVNSGRDGGFKLNNNFRSRYARLLMTEDPRFRDFFETRRLRSVGE